MATGVGCGSLAWVASIIFSLLGCWLLATFWVCSGKEIDGFLLLCEIEVWIDGGVCLIGILFFDFVCV